MQRPHCLHSGPGENTHTQLAGLKLGPDFQGPAGLADT